MIFSLKRVKYSISRYGIQHQLAHRATVYVKHNQTLTNIMLKVKDDTKCDYDTALAWAVFAKNLLINKNGFRPSQFVFGRNTNLPNFINNYMPPQETTTKSFNFALHISTLHAAGKAFTECESSNKLKLPIRKNIRPSGNIYTIGDKVYYKRAQAPELKRSWQSIRSAWSSIFYSPRISLYQSTHLPGETYHSKSFQQHH